MNKKFTKLMAAIALLVFMTPTMAGWGQTSTTYNFSSIPTTGWSSSGGSQTINSISWTYSSSTYIGENSSRIQVGSKKKPQTDEWTIQTLISNFNANATVTAVSITAYTTATTATYGISVGGESVKSGALTTSSATYSANNLNATSGSIVVTMQGSSNSQAMYLSNISVTYTTGGGTTTYTMTYNANGGTGNAPTDPDSPYTSGATVTVLGNVGTPALAKEHYSFNGWNTKADGTGTHRNVGSTFSIAMNSILYAEWSPNTHTVTLPAEDAMGTYTMDKTNPVAYNTEVTLTYTPKTGYENYEATWSVNGTAISGNKFTMPDAAVTVTVSLNQMTTVVDELTRDFTGVPNQTGTTITYKDWSGKTSSNSSAVYAGQSAGDKNSIQLRATNPSGIVTTTSGGKVKKITVTWNSNTSNGRKLDIYVKNSPYSQPADLYGNNKGTNLGSIVCGSSTELTVDGNYTYIGLRSNNGAMYIDNIEITWDANYSATMDIDAYEENVSGWHFIASPFAANQSLTWDSITTHIRSTDTVLYYYDEQDHYWRNIKVAANAAGFDYANGKGYLYANKDGVTLTFAGTSLVEGDSKAITLDYHATTSTNENNPLAGWNLVGNPFNSNATLNMNCYTITGMAINTTAITAGTNINPCQGVMVKATGTNQAVTFTKVTNSPTPQPTQLQVTVAQQVMNRGAVTNTVNDNVIVNFNEGSLLEKFSFNADAAKLYIPQNDKEYAIVSAEAQGELPLNFRANADGQYTLTINPEGVEMNYLHLIDNMTGNDIDLLQTPSYSFNAKTTDYESRFRLVFASNGTSTSSATEETFAFFNNGNLVVNNEGEATLQVIDVMGRVLSNQTISGTAELSLNQQPGVYVLRLVNGNDVKTQKIVVR